jgi:pimeloyl-ACP methyl ester carboxylesterase
MKGQIFVLVHPAWHGAWFWDRVAPLLRRARHRTVVPSLTGLGDRSHLARPDVGLNTHVDDVVALMRAEDVRNAILVGHSSSGAVITGVADRASERLAHVVYLDAFVPDHGQCVFDLVSPERREMFETLVREEGEGWLVPRFAPPPWPTIVRDLWGVTDDADVAWMVERLRPTPVGHFRDPVERTSPMAGTLPRTYIRCLRFPNPRFDRHALMARQSDDWHYRELDSSHHAPITMPDQVAELLIEAAR